MTDPSQTPGAPPRGVATALLARVLGGLVLAGLLAAAIWQRTQGGLQIELLCLAACLGPVGLATVWPTARLGSRSAVAPVLALAALAAVRGQAVQEWGLALGALSLTACAGAARATRPLPGGGVASGVALAAAAALSAVCVALGLFQSVLRALFVLPVLWEACAGWRARTPTATLRRALCGWALVVANVPELFRGSAWEGAFMLSPGLAAALGASWVTLDRGLREAAPADRKQVRRKVLRFVSPLAVLALIAFGGELLFRVVPNDYRRLVVPSRDNTFHQPHGEYEYIGWNYKLPEYDEPVRVRWNAHGWLDREHELQNAAGARRVLVVGDSFVEGVQVALEDHYHVHLERALAAHSKLRPVEAIAYGWSGWGQLDELEALTAGVEDGAERNLPDYPPGLDYEPELVVLEILPGNDILNNLPELEQRAEEDAASALRHQFARSLERGLYFSAFLADKADLLLKQVTGVKDPVESGVFQREPTRYPELWAEAWSETERLLGEIKAAVEARGARLVVVLFTSSMELNELREGSTSTFDYRYPSLRLVELCESLGIPCLDLAPRVQEHPATGEGGLHLASDGHWSATGHRVAAEATARWLIEEGHWQEQGQ